MPTTSVDMPAGLLEEIEQEVARGRYQSRSELIRDAVRRLIDERYTVDETLSEEAIASIQQARERGELEGDVRELIEDHL